MNRGSATAARMPTIAITTTSSIRVNPLPGLRLAPAIPDARICSDSRAVCAHSKPAVRLHQREARPLRGRACIRPRDQHHVPGNAGAAAFVGGEIAPQINTVYDFLRFLVEIPISPRLARRLRIVQDSEIILQPASQA